MIYSSRCDECHKIIETGEKCYCEDCKNKWENRIKELERQIIDLKEAGQNLITDIVSENI